MKNLLKNFLQMLLLQTASFATDEISRRMDQNPNIPLFLPRGEDGQVINPYTGNVPGRPASQLQPVRILTTSQPTILKNSRVDVNLEPS